jgi:hypothetical protein
MALVSPSRHIPQLTRLLLKAFLEEEKEKMIILEFASRKITD